MIDEYMPTFSPIHHSESKITVSDSCDLVYVVGRHDHVIYDETGGSTLAHDKHFIVLKKINSVWMVDGTSEMSY